MGKINLDGYNQTLARLIGANAIKQDGQFWLTKGPQAETVQKNLSDLLKSYQGDVQ